jgi:hypothetical protein
MKTKLVAVLFLMSATVPQLYADGSVLDQVSVALLGHTETVLETTTRGRTNAELLATPIQVGKWDADYIAGLDFGVLGDVKPTAIGQAGYAWTAGVHVHLSPLIREIMPKISPSYPALAALEINPRVSYEFKNGSNQLKGGWVFGLGIGWSFSLTPLK